MTTTTTGCERTESVAEYALRAMSPAETSAFEAHVAGCAECKAELAQVQAVVGGFTDWPVDLLRPATPLWGRLAERVGIEPGAPEARWAEEPRWDVVAPGISCKLLATDPETAMVSMLVRLAPGVSYPAHDHAGVEELHLLDGELWIEDRLLYPGDYNRGEPGTGDTRVYSETGCTCVLITSFRDILK